MNMAEWGTAYLLDVKHLNTTNPVRVPSYCPPPWADTCHLCWPITVANMLCSCQHEKCWAEADRSTGPATGLVEYVGSTLAKFSQHRAILGWGERR